MDIVVLAGGTSTERMVSISSGEQVCQALRKKGHRAVLLDVFFGTEQEIENFFSNEYDIVAAAEIMRDQTKEIEVQRKKRKAFFGKHVLEICQRANIVFLALHGENGENGKVQATFDLMGISYTGTDYLSSAICMNKRLSRILLIDSHVPMAESISLKKGQDTMEKEIPLPCVVKPCCGGSSIGVMIANNEKEYTIALQEAFSYEDEVIIEQYIEGREFSVGLFDGKALPVIEIAPKQGFYDYKNKYQAGATVETCPAKLSKEQTEKMQRYAEMAYQALGLHTYARIDFMMDQKGELYCLEANTLPGMTPTSLLQQEAAVIGLSYEDLCEKIIEISIEK